MIAIKKQTNRKIQKEADIFVELCKKELGKNLVSVVLFGSFARGTYNKWSDMDFCVIVKKRYNDKKEFELKMNLREAFGRHVDVVIREEEEITGQIEINSAVDLDIVTDGVPLYGKEAFLKYKPILKKYIKHSGIVRKQRLGKGVWVYERFGKRKTGQGTGAIA